MLLEGFGRRRARRARREAKAGAFCNFDRCRCVDQSEYQSRCYGIIAGSQKKTRVRAQEVVTTGRLIGCSPDQGMVYPVVLSSMLILGPEWMLLGYSHPANECTGVCRVFTSVHRPMFSRLLPRARLHSPHFTLTSTTISSVYLIPRFPVLQKCTRL